MAVNVMDKCKYRELFHAAGLWLPASCAGLWAWNTLSELFVLSQARYRHALAALCLLAILKWVVTPGRGARHGMPHP